MPRFGVRPRPVAGALLPLVLVLPAAPPAAAGDVAASAYASSLAMPGLLAEAPWLIHLHPQLAALAPTQIGATGTDSYGGTGGVQAILRKSDLSLFALSQSAGSLTQTNLPTELVQLGAAVRVGALRMGGAARATISKRDQTNINDEPDDTRDLTRKSELHGRRMEAAFGLGAGGDDTFLDLTFEVGRERFDASAYNVGPYDTLAVSLEGKPVTRYGGAARLGFRAASRWRCQLVGTFRDLTARVEERTTLPDSARGTRLRDHYGHQWRAGLSATRDLREGDLTVFGLYVNRDGPTRYDNLYASYRSNYRTIDQDEVSFGISHRRPFRWDTRLLVGFRNTFELTKDRSFLEDTDGDVREDVTTTERITRTFAWGLQRTFERLDLTGSMRTDLSAGDLFVSLDAVYRL